MPHSQLLEEWAFTLESVNVAGTRQLRDKHPVVLSVEHEIEQTLADYGYELVQITYGGLGRRRTLAVYMDKAGGVTAADCQQMAAQLSLLLDIVDPIPESYNLVVSSPGVERPLITDRDFERFAGRPAAITFVDADSRQTREGNLLGMDGDEVLLETERDVLRIPLDAIERAHLVYDDLNSEADRPCG